MKAIFALLTLTGTSVGASTSLADTRYVIHVVVDDLGYNDANFKNGQVQTPTMDSLVANGVELRSFYVYKMCAPSRGSVLTGRYPYHLGFYDNNGGDTTALDIRYKMLPALLKPMGWSTHALGKWHLGWLFRNYTPTWRGFDTFYGSSGNTGDYWYHLTSESHINCNGTKLLNEPTDFVDVREPFGKVEPAEVSQINGTYDARLLTQRTVELIQNHTVDKSMYVYLAYHNVHVPIQAPLETVQRFGTTNTDARKVTNAMLYEVDAGMDAIIKALQAKGMYDKAVFIVHTDNGGPGSHANNFPLRGGKFTFWEGGVRGLAFVSSPLIPEGRRGTTFDGIMHLADIYSTVVEGIAGGAIPEDTGPIQPDSFNLWPAILGEVGESPRDTVVHLPLSTKDVNTSYCQDGPGHGCAPSVRYKRWKLLLSWPGDDELVPLPPPLSKPVPYGQDGGIVRSKDQCIAPHWKTPNSTHQNNTCSQDHPCLFNVRDDPSETVNYAMYPAHQELIHNMTQILKDEAKTGAPYPDIVSEHDYKKIYQPMQCAGYAKTGFWLPVDYDA